MPQPSLFHTSKYRAITPIHFVPRFCSQCGSILEKKFVREEKCKRLRCSQCGFIAYLNPVPVAGAIPHRNGKILLLRRGIEPAKSAWTFPAGFVELGESVRQAAIRETKEEVGVKIVPGEVLGIYSYSDAGVATIVYLAEVVGGSIRNSIEAEEVREFFPQEIPWHELAFRSTRDALKDWAHLNREGSEGRICATLCYIRKNGKTLMLHRAKRAEDIHQGKWNGLGGKIEAGETPEECVVREVKEESGLHIKDPSFRGVLTFPGFDGENDWIVFLFVASQFSGKLSESNEGKVRWIPDGELVHLDLWEGDKHFLKWLGKKKFFSAKFVYKKWQLKNHHVTFYSP